MEGALPQKSPLCRKIIRRLGRAIWSRNRFRVYAIDLRRLPPKPADPEGVEFRMNEMQAVQILQHSGENYDCGKRCQCALLEQVADNGSILSGWVAGELAFYGWVQFKRRRVAPLTAIHVGGKHAFIYRCFTKSAFRGKGIYPAALHCICRQLAFEGRDIAFIDHHEDNTASQRGIERAGFRFVGEYELRKLFCLKWAVINPELRNWISGIGGMQAT